MAAFKNNFIDDDSSMKKAEPFVKPAVAKRNNFFLTIFDHENTSEMFMEVLVWLLVVGLVIFSM